MTRRYRRYESAWDEPLEKLISLAILCSLGMYFLNRPLFWELVWVVIVVGIFLIVGIRYFRKKKEEKFENTYARIRQNHSTEIRNFVDQFGREKQKESAFTFQGNNFSQEKLNYLQDEFERKGESLSHRDLFRILRRFIDEKERDYTVKSINNTAPKLFSSLSGSDFEVLLKHLIQKWGYTVELTGRTGDQGGDLVAIKDDERLVIQAKRYTDARTVGNDAVQQVIAAKGVYQCQNTMVVTTSSFTPEAKELARIHDVHLIDGKELRETLLNVLGESWS